jgi:AAA domain
MVISGCPDGLGKRNGETVKDRTNIERAKELLPMTALLDRLAPDWKKKNPVREDKHGNSFSVTPDDNGWNDNATGDKGDQIAFLEKRKGLSNADAIRHFLELAGVQTAHKNGHVPKSKPITANVNWPDCVVAFTDAKAQELADYRGYSLAFVQWLKTRDLVGIYRDDRGHDQFAFPLHDDSGKVVGIHHKHTDGKWRTQGSTRPLIIGDRSAGKWIVFESQWDAGAVMEALDYHLDGYEQSCAILVTRGAENGKFASMIPKDAEAVVVMQNDGEKNGRIASDDWLEEIKQHCPARLKVARPPAELKDCNDWLKRGDADFNGMLANAESTSIRAESICDISCDVSHDPDELLKHRFLCRGGGAMLNGPTGVGKSSCIMQAAILWALGKPFFGIEPARPLKSLIVQAENDAGDLVEQREGVFTGLGLSDADRALVRDRVFIRSVNSKTGASLITEELRPLLREHRPDLQWLDNMFSYAGCNVSDQEKMSLFLRNLINPLIQEFQCGIIIGHHTNKPPSGDQKADWSVSETAYMGSGTGELANWPRAILSIRALKAHGVFELVAGKRGSRLRWKDAEGKTTCRRNIAHSTDGLIYWREADANEVPAKPGKKQKHFVEDILRFLGDKHLGAVEWQELCKKEKGVSNGTFYDLKTEAEESKRIAQDDSGKWFKVV